MSSILKSQSPFNENNKDTFCKPNTNPAVLDSDHFWSTLREHHLNTRTVFENRAEGIHFLGYTVVSLGDLVDNDCLQLSRQVTRVPDHVPALVQSLSEYGWCINEEVIAVCEVRDLRVFPVWAETLKNVSPDALVIVSGRHRYEAMKELVSQITRGDVDDPHGLLDVFGHLLVRRYRFADPFALWLFDQQDNVQTLPSELTTEKDVYSALSRMVQTGVLSDPPSHSSVDKYVAISTHLAPKTRKRIVKHFCENVGQIGGNLLKPYSAKQIDAEKKKYFEPVGVPEGMSFACDDHRLTRPMTEGVMAWKERYDQTGENLPIVYTSYFASNQLNKKGNKKLYLKAERQKKQESLDDYMRKMIDAQLMIFTLTVDACGGYEKWSSMTVEEQAEALYEQYPLRFVGFFPQDVGPDANKNGRAAEEGLVDANGKPASMMPECYRLKVNTAAIA